MPMPMPMSFPPQKTASELFPPTVYSGCLVPTMLVTVKARVHTDATGTYTELPALLTPAGVLEPLLLDYCLYRSHDRSLAWMSKVVRSVRMFLEYLQFNPAERDTFRLFQNFARRLYTATSDRTTGLDPSGLCWAPRSPHDASHIVTHLTDFLDWLGKMRPKAAQVNSRDVGGAFDRQTDEAACQFRRSKAFLGHTWAASASPAYAGHRIRSQRLPKIETGEPPAFLEERFEELLVKGFNAAVCATDAIGARRLAESGFGQLPRRARPEGSMPRRNRQRARAHGVRGRFCSCHSQWYRADCGCSYRLLW